MCACKVGLLCRDASPEAAIVFDTEETLTHEDILRRFKKILGRNMTAEERQAFFLPPETPNEQIPEER